jgi:hypothetical protein
MKPTLEPDALRKSKGSEYVVRFVFGGFVTALTGLVAHFFGPVVGGLFLAFPAILPASLTLVDRHGGRRDAVDEARGACLGSIGLAAFALVTWQRAGKWHGAAVLATAMLAWLAVSVCAWSIAYASQPSRRSHDAESGHTADV